MSVNSGLINLAKRFDEVNLDLQYNGVWRCFVIDGYNKPHLALGTTPRMAIKNLNKKLHGQEER